MPGVRNGGEPLQPHICSSLSEVAVQTTQGPEAGMLQGGLPWAPGWSRLHGWYRVSGRKCLLSECVRWWGEARPGDLCQVASPPLESVPKSQTAFPLHSLFPGPGPARTLGSARETSPLSGPDWWPEGWLAKQSVTPQPSTVSLILASL